MAKEILSIQCGRLSNLVGAHWWNIQHAEVHAREIRHECMFREEANAATGSRTYTPRLLLLDIAAGQRSGDGSEGDTTPAWVGPIEKYVTEPEKGLKKCRLENDADVSVAWSSVLRVPLSRKSCLTVPERTSTAIDFYPFGLQVWEEKEFQADVEDRLRYFAEECDSIQGFHLLSDWSTGFGALAACIAEFISDQYSTKAVVAFPVSALCTTDDDLAALNTCLALDGMASSASLVCPLSVSAGDTHPWYSIAGENPYVQSYEGSVVMAAGALDTVTMFYRSTQLPSSCGAMCSATAAYGRKLGVLSASLPFPVDCSTPLSSTLANCGGLHALLHPLTPFFPYGTEDVLWTEALALRGMATAQPLWPSTDPRSVYPSRLLDLLAEQLDGGHPYQWSTSVLEQPLLLYPPSTEPATPPSLCVPDRILQVPVCASLQSRSGAGQVVAHLQDKLAHAKPRMAPLFTAATAHLEGDSFTELSYSLSVLCECYRTSSCSED